MKQNIAKVMMIAIAIISVIMVAANAATKYEDTKLLKEHLGEGIVIVDSEVGRHSAMYVVAYGHCKTEVKIDLHRNVKVGACK